MEKFRIQGFCFMQLLRYKTGKYGIDLWEELPAQKERTDAATLRGFGFGNDRS